MASDQVNYTRFGFKNKDIVQQLFILTQSKTHGTRIDNCYFS